MGIFGNLKNNFKDGSLMNGLQAARAIANGDYGTAAQIQALHARTLREREEAEAREQDLRKTMAALTGGRIDLAGLPPRSPEWIGATDKMGASASALARPSHYGGRAIRSPQGFGQAEQAPVRAPNVGQRDPIWSPQAGPETPGGYDHAIRAAAFAGLPGTSQVSSSADPRGVDPQHPFGASAGNLDHTAAVQLDDRLNREDQRRALLAQKLGSFEMPENLEGTVRHTPEGRIPLESVADGPIPYGDQEGSGRVNLSLQTATERLHEIARENAIQPNEKALLDRIAQGEGTDEETARAKGFASGNDVTYGYGAYATSKKPLSQMTLGEVKALQREMLNNQRNNTRPSSVVGRYQIKDDNLISLMRSLRYDDNTTFSPAVQDRMGLALLARRGLEDYRKGRIDAKEFQSRLAREWASIEQPDEGRSYYGQPLGTTSAEIQTYISKLRRKRP